MFAALLIVSIATFLASVILYEPEMPKVKTSTTRRPNSTRVSPDVLMRIFGAAAFNIMSPDDEPKVQGPKMCRDDVFSFTFDSGASENVVTLEAALALFDNQGMSVLRLVGVTGQQVRADLSGIFLRAGRCEIQPHERLEEAKPAHQDRAQCPRSNDDDDD